MLLTELFVTEFLFIRSIFYLYTWIYFLFLDFVLLFVI